MPARHTETTNIVFHNTAVVSRSFRMKTRRQLTAPPKREPVDSAMTGMRAQWQSGLETLSGIRQWKLRLQLAGRTASNHKPDQLGEYTHEQNRPSSREMQKMKSTSDVLDDHVTAIRQGDVNGVLSDYASDAVLFREDGVFKGVDAIRSVLEKFVAEFQKPGTISHTKQRLVEGDCAYMVWTAETADNVYELATDTFVVRNGKIVAQSFTAKITPKA